MKKLLAAWLCAVVVACAASSKQATMAPQRPEANTAGGAPSPMPGDPHAEIEQLSTAIDQERERMSLPAPPPAPAEPMSAHTTAVAPTSPPHAEDPSCHPGPSQTCSTSCDLSDSICKNKNRICEIAKGIPADSWAAGKCSTAQQTCDDSHKRCCECS